MKSVREVAGGSLLVWSIGRRLSFCAGGKADRKEEKPTVWRGQEITDQGEGMKSNQ